MPKRVWMSCVSSAVGCSTARAFSTSKAWRMAASVARRASASSPFTFALSLSTRTATRFNTFTACWRAFAIHGSMPRAARSYLSGVCHSCTMFTVLRASASKPSLIWNWKSLNTCKATSALRRSGSVSGSSVRALSMARMVLMYWSSSLSSRFRSSLAKSLPLKRLKAMSSAWRAACTAVAALRNIVLSVSKAAKRSSICCVTPSWLAFDSRAR